MDIYSLGMRSGTDLAREIKLTDWSIAGNLSNRSSGVPSSETQGLLTGTMQLIFLGESLLQELKSPWELILTEPVPEVVEFHPLIGQKNIFLSYQR